MLSVFAAADASVLVVAEAMPLAASWVSVTGFCSDWPDLSRGSSCTTGLRGLSSVFASSLGPALRSTFAVSVGDSAACCAEDSLSTTTLGFDAESAADASFSRVGALSPLTTAASFSLPDPLVPSRCDARSGVPAVSC